MIGQIAEISASGEGLSGKVIVDIFVWWRRGACGCLEVEVKGNGVLGFRVMGDGLGNSVEAGKLSERLGN